MFTYGVFPAHAGMSLGLLASARGLIGFPRPRGDEPKTATPKQPHFKFSPPTRG